MQWNEDGKAFKIVNQSKFISETLPIYYNHTNIASFIRQLNKFQFKSQAWGTLTYGHPKFQRGKPN